TSKPWPTFVSIMTFTQAAMYPAKAYTGKDRTYISKAPIGTGPYRFVKWSKDEEIVLEADPGHWRGSPRVKTVVVRPIPDDAVRVAALQNGEVDVAVNIPPHLATIIANHPKLFLTTAPSVRTIQLMYYTHQYDAQHKLIGPYPGPTADRRARLAMNYAVDVDDNIKNVLDGKAERTALMLTDQHFGHDRRTLPVWLLGLGTSTYDAEAMYVPLFRGGRFLGNYYSADFEGMIEQAQATMDAKKRVEIYHRINRLWVEDAAAMPLYQQIDLYGATKRVAWKARGDEAIKGYDMAVKDSN